jgi:hypothetical protein
MNKAGNTPMHIHVTGIGSRAHTVADRQSLKEILISMYKPGNMIK